jgi:hypothetical protein
MAATFQTLPGTSFVVNGAAQASDSVLTTASPEMKWSNGWSAVATFEDEVPSVTCSYAGKGEFLRHVSPCRRFRGQDSQGRETQQAIKFVTIVNLKTTNALGLTIPPTRSRRCRGSERFWSEHAWSTDGGRSCAEKRNLELWSTAAMIRIVADAN